MEDQPGIEQKYADSFDACEALEQFARAHRPSRGPGQTPIMHWTLARSARTFKTIVKLCRMGYGQQASMLNRTLFEDMTFAHWAARFPVRSVRLVGWHEEYTKLRRIPIYERHGIPHEMTRPDWDGLRRRRMDALFRRGTWTGRSINKMIEMVETMWPEGQERDRLHRMHQVFYGGFNTLMHHSSRSVSFGASVDDEGNTTHPLLATDVSELGEGLELSSHIELRRG